MVLPPNLEVVYRYFETVWDIVHPMTAAVLSQDLESGDLSKFESHLEAEEARLGNNLRAVDYVIDGVDTLPLIAGVGRIEKVRI